MLELKLVGSGKAVAADQSTRDILKRGFFGVPKGTGLELSVEETLYLMDSRNADCKRGDREVTFNDVAAKHWDDAKFIARYFTYKDWRDRGLVARDPDTKHKAQGWTKAKLYPASKAPLPKMRLNGTFFKADLMTVVDDSDAAAKLFKSYWIGQYGAYKAPERGRLNKLDAYETLFLVEKGMLKLRNATRGELVQYATEQREHFPMLYKVYKDWRDKGYVVKTGFKFGTHFRVYFPGTKPFSKDNANWTHSKHVIHVFPKESRLLISEWARAIRVAHSVRKTFILAVPGRTGKSAVPIDYVLFHRRGGEADSPKKDPPKYAMLSLGEDESIGGRELAAAISTARKKRLELLIAIADRETAVTYYRVRQIELPRSANEYYEIDWMQP